MKVVLPAKPCDAMGIIERAKREQVNLDDVYMIGLNCAGQLHPARMREMVEKVYRIPPESVRKEEIEKGKLIIYGDKEYARKIAELEELGYGRRESCRYCNILIPKMADLACGNWGAPPGKTFVEVLTEKGKEIFENAMERGYVDYEDATEEGIKEREKIYERMLKLSSRWREKLDFFAGLPDEKRLERYVKILERCISCGSCMEVCPICDCMERAKCLSEDEPYRVPFYILARIFHLMDSCIGCGQCEDVCPAEIPLTLIHQRFGRRIQKRYNYLPGMEVGRPPIFVSE
jgi:formate dehydrogenase subunit beta